MQPYGTSSILILRAKTPQHAIHGLRVISSNLWGLPSTIAPSVAPTVIQSLIKVPFRRLSSGEEKHFHIKWFWKYFSQCDSRNINLSPICDLSKTSLASWRPSVKSTYESVYANPIYLDAVQGPLRLKYPNDMAGKELITKLTEVVPNTLIWYFFVFLGKSDLQCLWERYSGRQHLFWGLNCIWLDSTISLLTSLFTSQSSRDPLRWAGLTLSQALEESVDSVWGSALFLLLRYFTGSASGSLRSSNKKLIWLVFVCC